VLVVGLGESPRARQLIRQSSTRCRRRPKTEHVTPVENCAVPPQAVIDRSSGHADPGGRGVQRAALGRGPSSVPPGAAISGLRMWVDRVPSTGRPHVPSGVLVSTSFFCTPGREPRTRRLRRVGAAFSDRRAVPFPDIALIRISVVRIQDHVPLPAVDQPARLLASVDGRSSRS
jgi:hypothetical protein